jgi:glycine/D-amino acid oxidase-like deaminating enzyme
MKTVEFLIVGNGLAGTMLAFEMLEKDLDFRIVASPQKNRASEIAAGMFNPLVFKRLTKSWMADELLPVMKHKYRELENLLGNQFYFEKPILKPLSEQEKQLWIERKTDSEFSKYISSIVDESPETLLHPGSGYGIVNGSGYVNLKLFLELSDQYFRQKGVLIPANFEIKNMEPEAKYFVTENVKASKLIFCEGAHLSGNPFFSFIKLVPVKGEILFIYAPGLSENYILNKQVFVLPVGNHHFKIGSTYEWKDLSVLPTEKGKQSIIERFEKLITVNYTIENHVAGIRPAVSDRRPVLGVHPEFRNLFVFNGLGTKGVMLAPYFAREMVQCLISNDYELNFEVDIKRSL